MVIQEVSSIIAGQPNWITVMKRHDVSALRRWIGLSLCIASLSTVVNCATTDPGRQIDFELTGTVLDSVTKQPIEGAYVFASYREDDGPPPSFKSWCARTRGMYTSKDGKYRFPVEKLGGQNPYITSAIKPGYFRGRTVYPEPEVVKKQDAKAYSGRDLYLIPQDPAKPDFHFGSGDEFCSHARTRDDAAAGVEFLRIELAEFIRLGAPAQGIDATRAIIERLEALPESPANNRK
jgi:hypothetical protein